jgi:hypothetical protein
MNTKKIRLMMLSLTAFSLAACAPARHSTTMMANEKIGSLTMFSGDEQEPGEDFEFPVFEDEAEASNEPIPAEPIRLLDSEGRKPAAWDGRTPNAAKFTELTEKALDALGGQILESVPRDISAFCPKYSELDREGRKGVWLMMISAMAKYESDFRPVASLKENFKNSNGDFVVSRGLMQISIESANGFGCRIGKEIELHDPATNLSCAVRILNRTVMKDGVVTAHDERWRGGARYWSVLRRPSRLGPIQQTTRSIASCG